ncbi:MAG TPA: HNH endonuclease [Anaeromyxobacteraceae bacterium]
MLESGVLVLNRVYQPVHVTSVRRAICLLYQGVAKAIDEQFQLFDFESWSELAAAANHDAIHTVTRRIRIPRVIVLLAYEHLPKARVRFSRFNIYARDDSTCQYCGHRLPRSELNLDHVVPRSRGGSGTWENIVLACLDCNIRKGDKLPQEARMKLLKKPVKPAWATRVGVKIGRQRKQSWERFLEEAYWDVELKE